MIELAAGLSMPDDFITQTCAVLARRGAGKTYTALKIAEQMAVSSLPFVVIDPTGVCWGLRSSASGNAAGLAVVILGGEHGDIALEPSSGRIVADFVIDSAASLILDLSLFESRSAQDRFVYEFADRLYRAKAKHREPLHLLVDEADQFAPQRPMPDQTRMLGAWESIIRLGRSRGLGATMITQRPAVLNKNVLTQIELLIVLQITSPQDRAAIKAWIDGNADADNAKTVLDSLASLQRGEAWVWSPAWLKVLQRITVAPRVTFDSSRTPDAKGGVTQPKRVADVDLGALSDRMAATIEHATANDPKRLKARIRELERAAADHAPEVRTEYVPTPIPSVVEELVSAALAAADVLTDQAKRLTDLAATAAEQIGDHTPVPQPTPRARPRPQLRPAPMPAEGDVHLKAGARRILETMARQHPVCYSRAQVGTLTGFKITGGTFNTYWSTLKRAGYINETGGLATVTGPGFEVVGVDDRAPMTPDEVLAQWRSALKAGARRMLDVIISNPGITRDSLADAVDMTATGGTFNTYLSTLRRNGLIEIDDDELHPTELLT